MKNTIRYLALGLLAGACWTAYGQGKPLIIDQHGDLNAYYNGAWDVTWHDWDWGVYRPVGPTWVFVGAAAKTTWPGGAAWSFFSNPGAQVWVIPQGQKPLVPYLGVATDRMPGNYFDSYFVSDPRINRQGRFIKYALLNVSGPGEFAMWQVDSFGNPTVWMATKDGIGSTDCLYNLEGGHTHYNWGFTATGVYNVTFQMSAYKNGTLVSSNPVVATFGVERLPSSPGQRAGH